MKARTLFLPIAAVLAALILYIGIVSSGSGADDPPAPQVIEVDTTVQGKTAVEWHAVASRYLQSTRARRRSVYTLVHSRSWGNHWLERAFLCIHSGEGAWSSNTGNGYDGGLQMDSSFQRAYGSDFLRWLGPAYRWPAAVQIAVGIRAYFSGRGFGPWPTTRRACGL